MPQQLTRMGGGNPPTTPDDDNKTEDDDGQNPPVTPIEPPVDPIDPPTEPPVDPIDPPTEPPVDPIDPPVTPPVDPYKCVAPEIVNTGKPAAVSSIKIYPLINVLGVLSPRHAYQLDTGRRAPTSAFSVYAADNIEMQIGDDANTLARFWSPNFVTRSGTNERLQADNLHSDDLVTNYSPSTTKSLSLPSFVRKGSAESVFRFTVKESGVTIPAYKNLDTSKNYYAKINYIVTPTINNKWCREDIQPCFDYAAKIAFECFVEKK